MLGFVVLLVGCKEGASALDTAVPSIPSDLPTTGDEPPDVAGVTAAHNVVRTALGIPDLAWGDELAQISADWLVELDADGCVLEHNDASPYGENLYYASVPTPPDQVVGDWAAEVEDYDYDDNSCAPGKACGHYTQVVWRDSTHVGCAKRRCAGGLGEIWMCSYDPPGNFVGERPY